MAIVTRRWYVFINIPGGQHGHWAYYFISNFPNACLTSANNICAVFGIYSEIISGVTFTYGTQPKSFTSDWRLDSYITDAYASGTPEPSGPGQKRYVYVRNF